jgi:beta-aspartyl-peptidase (threonine type)
MQEENGMSKALIVHGGAWDIPDNLVAAHRECCLAATNAGWQVLVSGGSALDAVETAIALMEDHPAVDAGIGAFLNVRGEIELDAGLIDGSTLAAGAIAAVQRIRHPIELARRVLESEHVLLIGEGAEQFARLHSVETCPPATFVLPREIERWSSIVSDPSYHVRNAFTPRGDTVGAVALDEYGNIASGTSTGGTPCKPLGRVGDSPLVGCGYYADSEIGGASCTGWGEGIARIVMAKAAVDCMANKNAMSAADWAVHRLHSRVDGLGGIITLDHNGGVGYAHNTPRMAFAYMNQNLRAPIESTQASG